MYGCQISPNDPCFVNSKIPRGISDNRSGDKINPLHQIISPILQLTFFLCFPYLRVKKILTYFQTKDYIASYSAQTLPCHQEDFILMAETYIGPRTIAPEGLKQYCSCETDFTCRFFCFVCRLLSAPPVYNWWVQVLLLSVLFQNISHRLAHQWVMLSCTLHWHDVVCHVTSEWYLVYQQVFII